MKKIAILLLLTFTILAFRIQAQDLVYIIEREHVNLIIEQDGTCFLTYNLTVRVEQGAIRRFVDIGMPNPDFQVIEAYEVETGAQVAWEEYHDYPYKVRLKPSQPINAGEKRTFILTVTTQLLYKDQTNPGNAGLMFTPSWFPVTVEDLRLLIVLPPGVGQGEVKNQPNWQNLLEINGRIALYWERKNLAPNEKLTIGISFPQKYLTMEPPPPPSDKGEEPTFTWEDIIILSFIGGIFLIIAAAVITSTARKIIYEPPEILIEALGPRKGLTAPEAALLIEEEKKKSDYSKILTMILYSLARKGAIRITSLEPLQIQKQPTTTRLRYYERKFLNCINNGTPNPDCLASVILTIHRTLKRKMRGYNRKQTIQYYKKIVERAWKQVQQAETPELKLATTDQNMEWLILHPQYPTRIRTILIDPTPTLPPPTWIYLTPKTTAEPVPITKLADQIATTIEKTATGLATTIEKTAQQITATIEQDNQPPPRPTITTTCACVSCACACACVSCACACASGGAG